MRLRPKRSTPPFPTSAPERHSNRVIFWSSLGIASVALLAACSLGDAPAAGNVAVATTADAPANARPCRANDDCGANHAGGLCVPKAVNKELTDGETFLERVMSLHDLITSLGDTSSSAPMNTILQQVRKDLSTYSEIAQGRVPGAEAGSGGGSGAQEPRFTREQLEQMQDAAWMQSGATQADMLIQQLANRLSNAPITTDAQKIHADILGDSTGPHLDQLVSDLQTFLKDIQAAVAQINRLLAIREADGSVPGPKSCAGALWVYVGPLFEQISDATSSANAFLNPSAIDQLNRDLAMVSRGHDLVGTGGTSGTCLKSP
jgi:hypothetical protein